MRQTFGKSRALIMPYIDPQHDDPGMTTLDIMTFNFIPLALIIKILTIMTLRIMTLGQMIPPIIMILRTLTLKILCTVY